MVSALFSGSSGPVLRDIVFLGKTLNSHSATLHPGVKWVPANLMLG